MHRMTLSRIARTFARLSGEARKAFVPYITAGDPDLETTALVLDGLVAGGADLIELGVPFSDPMADGPVIQAAMERSLRGGTTLATVLQLVAEFRQRHADTPLILFGYLNPLHRMGLTIAVQRARDAGADGFLVVDLPPEEAHQLTGPARAAGLDFIALFTPTSDDARVAAIAAQASGFAYYVSMAAITGDRLLDLAPVAARVSRVRAIAGLPVCVGFGIQSERDAAEVARFADGVVVGSSLVKALAGASRADARAIAESFARRHRRAIDEAVDPTSGVRT